MQRAATLGGAVAILILAAGHGWGQEYLTGIEWPKPPIITPGKSAGDRPSDAIALFDGKDLSQWVNGDKWKVEGGVATIAAGAGYIETKQHFGDSQLHIEWSAPVPATGKSQGRGNSGCFFGPYELQVLDSYENETYYDGQASAIYKQQPPMVNAMRPPGEWNAYDVIWTAPKFKDGKLESPAHITVLHNGVVTQNHYALLGDTPFNHPPRYEDQGDLPIRLQDHGNPVRFRNIWIRPLKPIVGKRVREPYMSLGGQEIPLSSTGKVMGQISLEGKPLAAAQVTLHADGGEGTYQADVRGGKFLFEGVKPGKYVVSVGDGFQPNPAAAIPARYRGQQQSPLRVQIAEGANDVALELTP